MYLSTIIAVRSHPLPLTDHTGDSLVQQWQCPRWLMSPAYAAHDENIDSRCVADDQSSATAETDLMPKDQSTVMTHVR